MTSEKSVLGWTEKEWEKYHAQVDSYLLAELSLLPKNTTIYTILRRVSKSGMKRIIDMFYVENGEPVMIHFRTNKVFQQRKNHEGDVGYTVSGCGMDMGFHLVDSLNRTVFPDDEYHFKQEWV